jgi:FlaA1/EpsC-like NDP-sugar epimerase
VSLQIPSPWFTADLEAVLGRPPRPLDITDPVARLAGERVLITGAAGSIGTEVNRILTAAGGAVLATDIDELDVGSISSVKASFQPFRPTVVIHLAGAKHAPEGELDPLTVVAVNAVGTANMVAAAAAYGARIVTASTCKACDPETAYGASKLLAERLTLSAGGNVARFYNVIETAGNVFEIWDSLPVSAPLPVTACTRFFITLAEATALILWTAIAPHGRYTINPGSERFIPEVATALYPHRSVDLRPPRRGDRFAEPRHAACEQLSAMSGVLERVQGPHDAFGGYSAPLQHAA